MLRRLRGMFLFGGMAAFLLATVVSGQDSPCLDSGNSAEYKCNSGGSELDLNFCGITDEDITGGHLASCFDSFGRKNILELYMEENLMTALPANTFSKFGILELLDLGNNHLETLPLGLFTGLGALETLEMWSAGLKTLPPGIFDPLLLLKELFLEDNHLTTLPDGIFDPLVTLTLVDLLENNLECLPAVSENTIVDVDDVGDECGCDLFDADFDDSCPENKTCVAGAQGYTCGVSCEDVSVCGAGEICCPVKKVCEPPLEANPAACGDPHMTGFRGQRFDFTGEDGGWYCLIKDDNMQVSMRVTGPVPSLPEITYITGLAVLTDDAGGLGHDIVIEVKDPYSLESSCPPGVSPCLADGALAVTLDGEEALLAPGMVSLGGDVEVWAANLPGSCRSFGFEKYWEMKTLETAISGRRLRSQAVGMGEWILGDPTATNMEECLEYVARAQTEAGGLFAHQSEHASFQIVTPKATLRLSHGRLHQVAMRDPTDSYDLPDHRTWQMNFAVDQTEVSGDAVGILGETRVPTLDKAGRPIMQGMGAIRGLQEDYRVDGPLGKEFAQGNRQD